MNTSHLKLQDSSKELFSAFETLSTFTKKVLGKESNNMRSMRYKRNIEKTKQSRQLYEKIMKFFLSNLLKP